MRKAIKSISKLPTFIHHQWWSLLNTLKGYKVEPFSIRYWWTRSLLVNEICELVINDPEHWLDYLKQSKYKYYDERIVEYSWVATKFSSLTPKARFLDVGCVMNTGYFLDKTLRKFSDVHFLNLVSEPLALHGRISFHSQDIRACDLPKKTFDFITCISTLEHVSGDNSYNNFSLNKSAEIETQKANSEPCWQEAFEALLNLLKPDGLLLVSMPYGKGEWVNGEYQIGEADIKDFYSIAEKYGVGLKVSIMYKHAYGWSQEPSQISTLMPKAGSNAVTLIETVTRVQ
jgi:SAM-dependent methyltransferase